MPAGSWWPVLACLIGLWPMVSAFGQDQPAAPPPQVADGPPAGETTDSTNSRPRQIAERSPLDAFYLRDKTGNLVPVLGLTFEEFERLLRLSRGLAPPPPPGYVITRLTAEGTVRGDVATFQLSLGIQVRSDGWVAVPLALDNGVLGRQQQYDGPGEHLLSPSETGQGYVCWLKGKDARTHDVRFEVSFPIRIEDDQPRMAASLPAATESILRLTLPQPVTEAKLEDGTGILTSEKQADGRSQLTVIGAAGPIVLSWVPGAVGETTGRSRLEATGEISVRVESEQRVTSEARLRVRSLGQPLESFVVRLAPGMELTPAAPVPEYALRELPGDSSSATGGQRIMVELSRPTTGAADVLIRAQRQPAANAQAPFRPADFVVERALRQRGVAEFLSEGDWQLDWSHEGSVHRLDLNPPATSPDVVARFEYFRQPAELGLRVATRPSRLSVEPTHMVYVDPRQLRVETLLKCRFRGARASGVRLQLGSWKLDRVTPEELFDLPVTQENGEVFVPLRSGAQLPAELEIKLQAHQAMQPDSRQVSFDFPQLAANNIAPATVLVFAADNVELTPSATDIVGLSPEATSVRLPGRQQAPLVYRDLGGGEAARFTAGWRTLERITTAGARAKVRIDAQQIQVEQRLEYRVAHEPQRVFPLLAPAGLVAAANPQVFLGDEPLPLSPAADAAAEPGLVRLAFTASADQIGAFQAVVRYALPLRWNRREALPLTIPLVVPALEDDDQFAGQQIEFSLGEGLQIEPDSEGLEESVQPQPLTGSALAYSWTKALTASQWLLESAQDTAGAEIEIAQMWAQTWLSPRVRQERVAIRLRADRETIVVKLDRAVKQSSVHTGVDGRETQRSFRQPGMLLVTLPPAVRGRECVVELSYTLDAAPAQFGVVRQPWRAAQVEDAQPPRRLYWQLVLPGDQQVLNAPTDLAAEMVWPSGRWFSRPRAVFDQRQLEAWIKATPQEPLPRGANDYLYGTLSRWPATEIVVVSRRTMVATASAVVLALGLLLLHVPALRRAELALLAVILIAGGAFAAPELTLLAAQASVLGLAIVAMASVWVWATSRPAPRRPVASPATVGPRESRSTRPPAQAQRSSRVTTTAHAAAMEVRP